MKTLEQHVADLETRVIELEKQAAEKTTAENFSELISTPEFKEILSRCVSEIITEACSLWEIYETTDEDQVNVLLKEGWELLEVTNHNPPLFNYKLKKLSSLVSTQGTVLGLPRE